MALNLGNKLEIQSLRHDLSQIQKQIDRLRRFISGDSNYDFRSWKYPTINAVHVDIENILQNYNTKEQNLEESKLLHILLLDLTIDRLLVLVQFTGIAFQNILKQNDGTDIARKTNVGLIIKHYQKLIENVTIEWRKKYEQIKVKWTDSSGQTDLHEISERNPCLGCEEHRRRTEDLFKNFSKSLKVEHFSTEITLDTVQQFADQVTKCFDYYEKTTQEIQRITKEITEFTEKNSTLEKNLQNLRRTNAEVEEANKIIKEQLERDAIQQKSKAKDLKILLIKLEELQRSHAARSLENEQWATRNAESKQRVDVLKDTIKKTELQLEMLDLEFERTTTTITKKNDILRLQIQATKEELRKFDGFDSSWTLRYDVLQREYQKLFQEWQNTQGSVEKVKHDIMARTMQLAVLKDEQLQIECLIRSGKEQLSSIVVEKERLQKLQSQSESPRSLSVLNIPAIPSLKAKSDVCAGFIPNSQQFSPFTPPLGNILYDIQSDSAQGKGIFSQNDSIRALFANFLEMPDFQSMPEWNLVSEFDTAEPELDKKIFSKIGDVLSRSDISKEDRSIKKSSKSSPKQNSGNILTVKSLSSCKISTANLSSIDVSKSIAIFKGNSSQIKLKKLPISEASWVVTKPTTKIINPKKK